MLKSYTRLPDAYNTAYLHTAAQDMTKPQKLRALRELILTECVSIASPTSHWMTERPSPSAADSSHTEYSVFQSAPFYEDAHSLSQACLGEDTWEAQTIPPTCGSRKM